MYTNKEKLDDIWSVEIIESIELNAHKVYINRKFIEVFKDLHRAREFVFRLIQMREDEWGPWIYHNGSEINPANERQILRVKWMDSLEVEEWHSNYVDWQNVLMYKRKRESIKYKM